MSKFMELVKEIDDEMTDIKSENEELKDERQSIVTENEELKNENKMLREARKRPYGTLEFQDIAMLLKIVRREIIADTKNEINALGVLYKISDRMKILFRNKGTSFSKDVFDNWVNDIYKDQIPSWFDTFE